MKRQMVLLLPLSHGASPFPHWLLRVVRGGGIVVALQPASEGPVEIKRRKRGAVFVASFLNMVGGLGWIRCVYWNGEVGLVAGVGVCVILYLLSRYMRPEVL